MTSNLLRAQKNDCPVGRLWAQRGTISFSPADYAEVRFLPGKLGDPPWLRHWAQGRTYPGGREVLPSRTARAWSSPQINYADAEIHFPGSGEVHPLICQESKTSCAVFPEEMVVFFPKCKQCICSIIHWTITGLLSNQGAADYMNIWEDETHYIEPNLHLCLSPIARTLVTVILVDKPDSEVCGLRFFSEAGANSMCCWRRCVPIQDAPMVCFSEQLSPSIWAQEIQFCGGRGVSLIPNISRQFFVEEQCELWCCPKHAVSRSPCPLGGTSGLLYIHAQDQLQKDMITHVMRANPPASGKRLLSKNFRRQCSVGFPDSTDPLTKDQDEVDAEHGHPEVS